MNGEKRVAMNSQHSQQPIISICIHNVIALKLYKRTNKQKEWKNKRNRAKQNNCNVFGIIKSSRLSINRKSVLGAFEH